MAQKSNQPTVLDENRKVFHVVSAFFIEESTLNIKAQWIFYSLELAYSQVLRNSLVLAPDN